MSRRADLIRCLVSSGHALHYAQLAERMRISLGLAKEMCHQCYTLGYLHVAGTERSGRQGKQKRLYRPTPRGLELLAEDYAPSRAGAATRAPRPRKARMPKPEPARAPGAIWEVWT